MKLPMMSDKAIMRPAVMTSFGGINHNPCSMPAIPAR